MPSIDEEIPARRRSGREELTVGLPPGNLDFHQIA